MKEEFLVANPDPILIRRIGTVFDAAREVAVKEEKSFFRSSKKLVLQDELRPGEELVFLRRDGTARSEDPGAIALSEKDKELGGGFLAVPKGDSPADLRGENKLAEGECLYRLVDGKFEPVKNPAELPYLQGLRLFAVQCDPFPLSFLIDLGRERDHYRWDLALAGKTKIKDPAAFLLEYYSDAKEAPFTVQSFIEALGTRPENLLLDTILHESMRVRAIDDLNLDVARWAKDRNLTEDAFTTAFSEKTGTPFSENGTMKFTVNSVRFSSPERDKAIADAQKTGDMAAATLQKNAEDIAALQQEIEKAKLNNQKAEIEAKTASLQAKSKAFLENADALDKLMNMDFANGKAPILGKLLAAAGREDAVARILAAADASVRAGEQIKMDLEPRYRAIGPRLREMKQGCLYGLSIESPQNGHLAVLDICDDNSVIPVVPCLDSKTRSAFVRKGQNVFIGQASSPWLTEPFEQYDNSGMDRFVAFVTDKPVLRAEESVMFGGELPASTVQLLAERLGLLRPDSIGGGVLQVRIKAR